MNTTKKVHVGDYGPTAIRGYGQIRSGEGVQADGAMRCRDALKRFGVILRSPPKTRLYPTSLLEQIRSLRVFNRHGDRIAFLGVGSTFEPDSDAFLVLVEVLKETHALVTPEYGYREVNGKEILFYLEENDKVVVLTQAGPGNRSGRVVKFQADGANDMDAPLDSPPISIQNMIDWAKLRGLQRGLEVISVKANGEEDLSSLRETLMQIITQGANVELPGQTHRKRGIVAGVDEDVPGAFCHA